MAIFDAFLPIDRRMALGSGQELKDRPHGSALFADISGFTPLSAALAGELGARRGAEELHKQVNRVFSAIIAGVHDYRGAVIGFSGDALTCWFDEDDGRRAVTAAAVIQEAIQALGPAQTPGGAEIVIGLKIGIAAGAARRFLVGDPSIRQIEVLAGSILDRTAAAEMAAQRGEVIISGEVRQHLEQDLQLQDRQIEEQEGRYYLVTGLINPAAADPWPAVPTISREIADRWIHDPVSQRLAMSEGQFVSDLRLAVPFFMKFSGIEYDDDPQAGDRLNAFVSWVQKRLAYYGGTLEDVTLGDKGSYLAIVFGAPTAHEDDVQRALAAALALRTPPEHLHYIQDIQIGINRGRVHAGTYGAPQRAAYGIQGEAANIAARMMSHAQPGKIMTSAKMAASVARTFHFQPLQSIEVKGIEGPLSVVYVEGQRLDEQQQESLNGSGGIFGRKEEIAQINDALHALGQGRSGIVIIEGEAGIGKTRLVESLKNEATQLGIAAWEGAGSAIEQSSPYFAWGHILQNVFDLQGEAGPEDRSREKRVGDQLQTLGKELVDLAPLLNAPLHLDFAENARTEAMNGEDRANNLNHLIASLLTARAAAGPLLLILEDAHWLDASSWGVARALVREVTPMLLVIVARPPSAPTADLDYFKRHASSKIVSLKLLSSDATLAIVKNRLQIDQLPQAITRLILDKAEGHPFFSEELAYALRDAGHIKIEGGQMRLMTSPQELQRLTFPDTIQGVITSRIDGVSARQQLLLKVASVIGRIFAYNILRDISPLEGQDEQIRSEIIALEKLEITPLERPDPELTYIFRHIITQEVVYSLLTFNQRKQLHQAAAQWYESNQKDSLAAVYPLLAYHWSVTETDGKAIYYALQAGRQALKNGAFREAIKHLSDGLARNEKIGVITDAAELARWRYRLGTAHRQVGQMDESLENYLTALDILGKPFPDGRFRLPLSLMGQLGRQLLHRLTPQLFEGRAKAENHPLLLAQIYEGLQHVTFYQDRTVESVYSILRHLNLGEEGPPSAQRARSYGAMVNVAGVIGLHKQALGYVNLAQDALQIDVNLSDRGLVLQYLSIYYAGAGLWAKNEAGCREAIEIADRIGNNRRRQENLSCLALALLAQGDVARSYPMRRQVLEEAQKVDDPQIQIWGWIELAEVALMAGRPDEAADYLQRAQAIEDGRGLTEEIWLYGLKGAASLRAGNLQEAKEAVDTAQAAISRSSPGAFYLLEALSGMAEVNLALWQAQPDQEQLKKRMKRTVDMLKQFARSFPFSKPRSLLWEGAFNLIDKGPDAALKLWSQGLQRARHLNMAYDEALILQRLAEQNGQEEQINKVQEIMNRLRASVPSEDR